MSVVEELFVSGYMYMYRLIWGLPDTPASEVIKDA
jgi:hypothetical protein